MHDYRSISCVRVIQNPDASAFHRPSPIMDLSGMSCRLFSASR